MEQLLNYKRKVAGAFFPIEGGNLNNDLPSSDEYLYSEKIDGHLAFAVVKGQQVEFYNRSGTLLKLPSLEAAFPKVEGIWAGELYVKKERSRSFLVSTSIANAEQDLSFAVFDAVHELDKRIQERAEIVTKMIPASEKVHPVSWKKTDSKKEVIAFYDELLGANKEGIVVHTAQGISYKIKPSVELDVTILGYGLKEDGSGIRSLLVGLKDQDKWMVVASVGGGFSEEDRAQWMEKLKLYEVEGDYVMVAKNKLAYHWIRPEIVIQIKCIEPIAEDATGVILKETLQYDEKTGYTFTGKKAGVSLVSPVFQLIRTDKKADADDTGIKQVTDRMEIATGTVEVVDDDLSTVVKRKVFTKAGKNGVAVRKFLLMKTNKDKGYPEFYVFYTDFSAGRKEPLQTDIVLASTEELAIQKLDELIAENIKKGWEEV